MARPLKKRDRNGEPYRRPPGVEAEIDAVSPLPAESLRARSEVTDRASKDYLSSECLTYLLRTARRLDDDRAASLFAGAILQRVERLLLKAIDDNAVPGAEELRDEILGAFAELLSGEGPGDDLDELDYYECRFNLAFKMFRIDLTRAHRVRHQALAIPLPDAADEAGDDSSSAAPSDYSIGPIQEDSVVGARLREAINALPPDERNALVLCRIMGHEEESADPTKQTAASICGVSGRTIRNRLNRAVAKLSRFKEEL